jgi:hypothetical protein
MILKLTIECVFGLYLEERWVRVVEIEDQASLLDLHNLIQDEVKFDRDHLINFFLANSPSPYAHKERMSEADRWEDRDDDYKRITLSELYPLRGKRLYYMFDFGDNWLFEIRMRLKSKKPDPGAAYPRIVERIGPNPQQYPNMEGW